MGRTTLTGLLGTYNGSVREDSKLEIFVATITLCIKYIITLLYCCERRMEFRRTTNQFTVDYKAYHQDFVGAWLTILGVLTIILPGLLFTFPANVAFIVGGLVCAIIGIFLILSSPHLQTRVSCTHQAINIRKTTRLKRFDTNVTISLHDIVKVEVASINSSGGRKGKVVYFILTDGEKIKVGGWQQYNYPFEKNILSSQDFILIAKDLAGFCGVPLDNDPNKFHTLDS